MFVLPNAPFFTPVPSPDQYLRAVLGRHELPWAASLLQTVTSELRTFIAPWAGAALRAVRPTGSCVKGTAVKGQTDFDVFVSISSDVDWSLHDLYFGLRDHLREVGLQPRQQDVSLGIVYRGAKVDVTVGREQPGRPGYHSIYRSRADRWTLTNVDEHVEMVQSSGRLEEIRLLKIWRRQKGIDLPSFLLEVATLLALQGRPRGYLEENLRCSFRYLALTFPVARIVDPANSNNIVSDDLTDKEKLMVARHAAIALRSAHWTDVVR